MISIRGKIAQPGEGAAVHLEIQALHVPVDEHLDAALKPAYKRALDLFREGGQHVVQPLIADGRGFPHLRSIEPGHAGGDPAAGHQLLPRALIREGDAAGERVGEAAIRRNGGVQHAGDGKCGKIDRNDEIAPLHGKYRDMAAAQQIALQQGPQADVQLAMAVRLLIAPMAIVRAPAGRTGTSWW